MSEADFNLMHYDQTAQLWFLWNLTLQLAGALEKVWGSCDGRLLLNLAPEENVYFTSDVGTETGSDQKDEAKQWNENEELKNRMRRSLPAPHTFAWAKGTPPGNHKNEGCERAPRVSDASTADTQEQEEFDVAETFAAATEVPTFAREESSPVARAAEEKTDNTEKSSRPKSSIERDLHELYESRRRRRLRKNTQDFGATRKGCNPIAIVDQELDQSQCKDLETRRRVFKDLILKWHPDKNQEEVLAAEVFRHLMDRRDRFLGGLMEPWDR